MKRNNPIIAESIPVGQSIDSAEYAALESKKEARQVNVAEEAKVAGKRNGFGDSLNRDVNDENKQDVEDAVIKIQALVRGHLTRKALKDAHQHNALGQSQFDEESLTKNRKYK